MSVDEHTERLRTVLHEADGGPFEPDVADVRARARHLVELRRRRRAGLAVAAVAASAAVVFGLTQLTGDDPVQQVVTGDPDAAVAPDGGEEPDPVDEPEPVDEPSEDPAVPDDATVPDPAPPETTEDAGAWPAGEPLPAEQIVAVVAEPGVEEGLQRLVAVDRTTGEIVADLAPGVGDSEGGILDVALAPDRRSIWYAVSTSACDSEVRVVGASSPAEPVVLGPGADVAVSPDGTRLAVTVDTDCDGHDQLRVVDLAGSRPGALVFDEWDELVADGEADGLIIWLDHLTWVGPDELLYQVTLEDGVQLQRHDLTDPSLLTAGGVIVVSVDPLEHGWMTPGGSAPWVADQCVIHQEGSCAIEIVGVDLDTGQPVGTPIPSPAVVTNIAGTQPVWTTAPGELYAWQGSEALRLDAPASLTWVDVAD